MLFFAVAVATVAVPLVVVVWMITRRGETESIGTYRDLVYLRKNTVRRKVTLRMSPSQMIAAHNALSFWRDEVASHEEDAGVGVAETCGSEGLQEIMDQILAELREVRADDEVQRKAADGAGGSKHRGDAREAGDHEA